MPASIFNSIYKYTSNSTSNSTSSSTSNSTFNSTSNSTSNSISSDRPKLIDGLYVSETSRTILSLSNTSVQRILELVDVDTTYELLETVPDFGIVALDVAKLFKKVDVSKMPVKRSNGVIGFSKDGHLTETIKYVKQNGSFVFIINDDSVIETNVPISESTTLLDTPPSKRQKMSTFTEANLLGSMSNSQEDLQEDLIDDIEALLNDTMEIGTFDSALDDSKNSTDVVEQSIAKEDVRNDEIEFPDSLSVGIRSVVGSPIESPTTSTAVVTRGVACPILTANHHSAANVTQSTVTSVIAKPSMFEAFNHVLDDENFDASENFEAVERKFDSSTVHFFQTGPISISFDFLKLKKEIELFFPSTRIPLWNESIYNNLFRSHESKNKLARKEIVDILYLIYGSRKNASLTAGARKFYYTVLFDPFFIVSVNELCVLLFEKHKICPKCLKICGNMIECDDVVGLLLMQTCYMMNLNGSMTVKEISSFFDKVNPSEYVEHANKFIASATKQFKKYLQRSRLLVTNKGFDSTPYSCNDGWLRFLNSIANSSEGKTGASYVMKQFPTSSLYYKYGKHQLFFRMYVIFAKNVCFRCFRPNYSRSKCCSYNSGINICGLFMKWTENKEVVVGDMHFNSDTLFSVFTNVALFKEDRLFKFCSWFE